MAFDRRRFDPQRQHVLLDPQRQARWDPPRFLARFGLQAGQTVLDLGCSPGFWTLSLAEIIGPSRRVWALDVSQDMLNALMERQPPAQVRPLRGELPAMPLPNASVDLAWGAFVFHEITPPEDLAAELRRVMRPGGRVAVLDWRPDAESDQGPPRHHRLWPEQVIDRLRQANFAHVERTWQDADTYLVEAAEGSSGT